MERKRTQPTHDRMPTFVCLATAAAAEEEKVHIQPFFVFHILSWGFFLLLL